MTLSAVTMTWNNDDERAAHKIQVGCFVNYKSPCGHEAIGAVLARIIVAQSSVPRRGCIPRTGIPLKHISEHYRAIRLIAKE